MYFERELNLSDLKTSVFLFGPRMTGKTTILNNLEYEMFFDLLDPETELELKLNPKLFWEQISVHPDGARIIVDEIQKVPELLNYVQMGIDRKGYRFILSGSSARKLKRGGANLLGGRALDLKLYSLSYKELGKFFLIDNVLQYGSLPLISSLLVKKDLDLVRGHLSSYYTTYIKEEIQAEALTRNIGAFQRFLQIAAQSNAQIVEFSNISRESSVPASTVKEYYQILEDTQLGRFLLPYNKSERKKSRSKFYFFDNGVVRTIQKRLTDPSTPNELGYLFETWFFNELIKIRDYGKKSHDFSFWRDKTNEIDILVQRGNEVVMAFECKSGRNDVKNSTLKAFGNEFGNVPVYIVSLKESKKRKSGNITVLPWKDALELYKNLT